MLGSLLCAHGRQQKRLPNAIDNTHVSRTQQPETSGGRCRTIAHSKIQLAAIRSFSNFESDAKKNREK